eukprot:gnl/TRDRNA2_/TRDRNA2_176392_c0_seq44.p1 gnl/TRDRNA2_/TRDRNA2_176392_c0~~gnl/TRDRNA2_/TRDRNA2_176392_c0_seq44.p1  ORF type:complete len:474 (-),score=48.09 gnl/TRDRNA2_/TRDRNA2_176392_c0_seq44:382-1803(-)
MSKPILPVLTMLTALFICVEANSASEATMSSCLAGSTNPTCSDFQASPSVKDVYSSAGGKSWSLLQTKTRRQVMAASKPSPTKDTDTRVYITKPTHRLWKGAARQLHRNAAKGQELRPLWQKTVRCSGSTMDDCEECVGNINCWGDCAVEGPRSIPRCVHVNSQNKWKRFVILIHIRCEGRMQAKMRPKELRGGLLNLYWDDEPLTSFDKGMPHKKRGKINVWQTVLKTNHKGGNTFMVEFAPSNFTDAFGKFNDMSFLFRTEFATCLDSKACLDRKGPLGGEEGMPLRASSELMYQCLKTGMDKVNVESLAHACKEWKACLKKSDPSGKYKQHLLTILKAAGADSPKPSHVALKQLSPPSQAETAKCIHPPHEDPLSWNCDCYEQMTQRCRAIGVSDSQGELCLRAQFCEFPDTCQHWKDVACHQQSVIDMSGRLRAALLQGRALMGRASHEELRASYAAEMDQTTEHKACA